MRQPGEERAQPDLFSLAAASRPTIGPRRPAGIRRRSLFGLLAVALVSAVAPQSLAPAAAAQSPSPAALVDPAAPGPNVPSSGRSVFEGLFKGGVPFPFSAVLDRLKAEAGPDHVATALIPLGRSLHRFAAHPNYFASPRLVVAITGDRASGPATLHIADRLYIGYQPASDIIEVLSYNEDAGRFEFQEIIGYANERDREIRQADRHICVACHQGHGPIFTRPLWSETNANPAIAQRLAGLGAIFLGAPVHQTVDAVARFNAATDSAARIAFANRLWRDACPDARCRAGLLLAALRFGLNGSRPEWRVGQDPSITAVAANAARLWPGGLEAPSADLVNRDPLPLLANMPPEEVIETKGALNPETPRAKEVLWRPGADVVSSIARELAGQLAHGDFAWLDSQLQRAAGPAKPQYVLPCRVTTAHRPDGARELRYTCSGAEQSANGFVIQRGDAWHGRLEEMRLAGAVPLRSVTVQGAAEGDLVRLTASLTGTGASLSPRLADGRRVCDLEFTSDATGATAVLRFSVHDDLALLAPAVFAGAEAGHPALAAGQPFRRQQVLQLLASLLENEHAPANKQ